MSESEIYAILAEALASRFGIEVRTNDVDKVKRYFYSVRKEHEEFSSLTLRSSPHSSTDLWIMKNAEGKT